MNDLHDAPTENAIPKPERVEDEATQLFDDPAMIVDDSDIDFDEDAPTVSESGPTPPLLPNRKASDLMSSLPWLLPSARPRLESRPPPLPLPPAEVSSIDMQYPAKSPRTADHPPSFPSPVHLTLPALLPLLVGVSCVMGFVVGALVASWLQRTTLGVASLCLVTTGMLVGLSVVCTAAAHWVLKSRERRSKPWFTQDC
jgi:hypothetical protein